MDSWQLIFTKQAEKDARKLVRAGLAKQADKLLDLLRKYKNRRLKLLKTRMKI